MIDDAILAQVFDCVVICCTIRVFWLLLLVTKLLVVGNEEEGHVAREMASMLGQFVARVAPYIEQTSLEFQAHHPVPDICVRDLVHFQDWLIATGTKGCSAASQQVMNITFGVTIDLGSFSFISHNFFSARH